MTQAPPSSRHTDDVRVARVHLRLGQLTLARAELEDLFRRDALDGHALAALAEARWRTGDAAGAAEAAFTHIEAGGADDVALCIAAEAAAADGRADGGAGPDGSAAGGRCRHARRALRRDAPARVLAGRAGRPERPRRAAPRRRSAQRRPRARRPAGSRRTRRTAGAPPVLTRPRTCVRCPGRAPSSRRRRAPTGRRPAGTAPRVARPSPGGRPWTCRSTGADG